MGKREKMYDEFDTYLSSKLSGLPEHEIKELAAYIANMFNIALADAIEERDRMWRREMKRPIIKRKNNQEEPTDGSN